MRAQSQSHASVSEQALGLNPFAVVVFFMGMLFASLMFFSPGILLGYVGLGDALGDLAGNVGAGLSGIGSLLPGQSQGDTPGPEPASNLVTVIEPSAQAVNIDVMMIGDILAHDGVIESGLQADGSYNFDHIYAHIADDIQAADIRIVNHETMIGGAERGYAMTMGANGPRFNSPAELADASAKAGFNVVLKAHNHTYDQGYDGLANELAYWRSNYPNIPILGVRDPNDPYGANWVDNVYIYEKDGFKVAILNYVFGINEAPDWEHYYEYAVPLSESRIRADVAAARAAGAHAIIACPHWGTEYLTSTSAEQEYFASLFCELGVDVVFGTHPHILEPVRVMENADGHQSVVFFSNGNFIAAGMPTTSQIAGISKVSLVQGMDGSVSITHASLVPVIASQGAGTACTTYKLADYTNDIAAASYRPELTVELAQNFCAEVLGPGYNRETSELVVI